VRESNDKWFVKELLFARRYGKLEQQRLAYEKLTGFNVHVVYYSSESIDDSSVIDLDPDDWHEVPILKELPSGD